MKTCSDKRPISRLIVPVLIAALGIATGGCAVGPDFTRPEPPATDRYGQSPVSMPVAVPPDVDVQRLVDGMEISWQWWTLFQSPPLNDLIDRAIKANPDLQAAQSALLSANEIRRAGQGAFLPSVDLGFQPTRQKIAIGSVSSSAADGSALYNLHTAQVSVGYSPDVFGGVSRGVESLRAQAEFQRFQLAAAYLTLTSTVVNAAIQEASLRAQIAASHEIIEINLQLLESLRRQHGLGHIAVADIAQQDAALAQARAMLPPLEKQLAQQRHLLSTLIGRLPSDEPGARFELASLQLPPVLPLSLPSTLVEHRPDIRAAEENLHAASAQIGVAMAARLPSITLSANLGSTAYEIGQLLTAGAGFWMLAGNLAQPIFRGGALLHQQRAAEAAYEQAAAQYRSAVLSAFRDVADTLHAIQADTQAHAAALTAERASATSLAIATRQFELGDIGYASVLAARQSYQQTQLNLIQAQASRLADSAALFQALGGGWWNRGNPDSPAIGDEIMRCADRCAD